MALLILSVGIARLLLQNLLGRARPGRWARQPRQRRKESCGIPAGPWETPAGNSLGYIRFPRQADRRPLGALRVRPWESAMDVGRARPAGRWRAAKGRREACGGAARPVLGGPPQASRLRLRSFSPAGAREGRSAGSSTGVGAASASCTGMS